MPGENVVPVRYFAPRGLQLDFDPPKDRLPIVLLTSVRDLVKERIGRTLRLPKGNDVYVKGTLERTIDELREGHLARFVDLVAIVTDDLEKDLVPKGYPVRPTKGEPWIHPYNIFIDRRTPARDLYFHIPSTYRLLPKADHERRAEQKLEFEGKIRSVMRSVRAEILVSDHFLLRIEYLIRNDIHGLFGKVFNIHPGITHADHPLKTRGIDTYEHAIAHAKIGHQQCGIDGPNSIYTGASFHIVDQGFDTGPVVCDTASTPVYPDDEWEMLAARNHQASKPLVMRGGLTHLASHLLKPTKEIDWHTLEPIQRLESLSA